MYKAMKATLELTPKSVWEEKATTINNAQTRTAKGVTEQKKMACMTSTSHRQFRLSRDYRERESSDRLLWDEQTWLTALWSDGFSCWVVTRKVLGGTETPDGGGGGWGREGGRDWGGGGTSWQVETGLLQGQRPMMMMNIKHLKRHKLKMLSSQKGEYFPMRVSKRLWMSCHLTSMRAVIDRLWDVTAA